MRRWKPFLLVAVIGATACSESDVRSTAPTVGDDNTAPAEAADTDESSPLNGEVLPVMTRTATASTFRVTLPTGQTFDATIPGQWDDALVGASVQLTVDGIPRGGGAISPAPPSDLLSRGLCQLPDRTCAHRRTEPLPDGSVYEEFNIDPDGDVIGRLTFGAWSMVMQAEAARRFDFGTSDDGFPLVTPRDVAAQTSAIVLALFPGHGAGRVYIRVSDAGSCDPPPPERAHVCVDGVSLAGGPASPEELALRLVRP